MGIFNNPFFSLAGQVERFTNVKDTLIAAVTGKVQSNTGISAVDTALSTAASHPFITAGVVASVANPTGALSVAKSSASAIKTAFIAAPKTTSAAVIIAPLAALSAVKNPVGTFNTARSAIGNTAGFYDSASDFIAHPSLSNAETVAKEHPYITTGIAVVGIAATGAVGTIVNILNTSAVKKNTEATLNTGGTSSNSSSSPSANISPNSNGHDEDIAKANAKASQNIADTNAKASVDIAKIQAQSNKDTLDAQLKALSMQSVPIAKKAPAKTKKKAKKKPKKKSIKKKKKKKR